MGIIGSLRVRFGLILFLLAAASLPARAAFTNGRDSFSGTTLDTVTWLAYNAASITQNNGLTINGFGEVTSSFTIGPGTTVRVPVTISSINYSNSGSIFVMLTTDSAGPNFAWNFDNAYMGIEHYFGGVNTNEGAYPNGYGYTIVNQPTPLNQTVIYEINRVSHSSAVFSVYNSTGSQLLGRYTDNSLGSGFAGLNIPDQLHIALYAQSATARFDYVDIPEPAALGVLGVLPILLRRRRRR